jgi:hypothetical protein
MKMKRTNFYYPQPMLDALKTMSLETGVPVSELIRRAVSMFINAPDSQVKSAIDLLESRHYEVIEGNFYDSMQADQERQKSELSRAVAIANENYATAIEVMGPFARFLNGHLESADDSVVVFGNGSEFITVRQLRDVEATVSSGKSFLASNRRGEK